MMKKILFILAMVCLTSALAEDWDGSTSKPSSKTVDGVEYYVITSPSELAWFAYQVNTNGNTSINAILENDIYYMDDTTKLSSQKFTAIGNKTNPYNGIIDGNGKSVYGANGTFLVDENTTNAVIKNLALKNVKYTSVVDTNQGTIENVELYGQTAFGFAAYNSGTIRKCLSFAEISAKDLKRISSGIAYENANDGKIISCRNFGIFIRAGLIIAPDTLIGGISVYNEGLIDSSESLIDLKEANEGVYWDFVGALGGISAYNSGTIKNSSGNILLPDVRGEIFGTRKQRFVASIAARNSGTIESSYGTLYVKDLMSSINEKDALFYGGIAGASSGLIQKCHSIFTIDTLNIGIGSNSLLFIGGLVGANQNSSKAEIKQSYSEMHVNQFWISEKSTDISYVGGVIGHALNTEINDSHGIFHIGEKHTNSTSSLKLYWAGLTRTTLTGTFYEGYGAPADNGSAIKNSYVVLMTDSDVSDNIVLSGIADSPSEKTTMSNVYFDKDVISKNYTNSVEAVRENKSSEFYNTLGKTTAVMQSPAFVETLNTNAGLDDDSGIWQYCEGNYPILVSEGSCDGFYSKYGLSSNSQSSSSSDASLEESSSSESISSSSSGLIIESSSSEEINISSSSNVFVSSSSVEVSSSSEETISSSSKKESSSSMESVSSSATTFVYDVVRNSFNLAVNGMTLTLSNTQGGTVQIFDALGHLVTTRLLSANGSINITMPTVGSYIVRVNGETQMVTLR